MLADKVTGFFVEADDFCKEFEVEIRKNLIESEKPGCRMRKSQRSDAEIMSILLLFHYSQFTNFKAFYTHLTDLFPDLVFYQRLVALNKKVAVPLMMFFIGWFFGFKLHLIINDKGEIIFFFLTKGNVDDRDFKEDHEKR